MNQLRKKVFFVLMLGCVVLFFCVFLPAGFDKKVIVGAGESLATKTSYDIVVPDAGAFAEGTPGIYLTRPEKLSTNSALNVYQGSISTDLLRLNKSDFYPEFKAMIMQNDSWRELNEEEQENFWVEATDLTYCSVNWFLRESAPAALYGVCCDETRYGVSEIFQILYAGEWSFVTITNDSGMRSVSNFAGGSDLTLALNVFYNDGAAKPDLSNQAVKELSTGIKYGALSYDGAITSDAMFSKIVVKTISGEVYNGKIEKLRDRYNNNRIELRFSKPFQNDIYLIQFTSSVGGQVFGQFIIDNSHSNTGINLSRFWVILMVFGGVLALGAALAYLVPLMIVRVNEARVYHENERIARIKNPEAYASKGKKSLKEIFSKIIYNMKTPVYKRKPEEKVEEQEKEQKVYSNRFTEMLRERQEKRDYMRKNNITSEEMERRKIAEEAVAADEVNSFASLRDDDEDDEIATFHAAEDEVSTLETGAYVQDGARFARLDSLTEDDPIVSADNGSDGNGDSF